MADLNTALRNSMVADAIANLNRLEILDGAANVLVTFTVTWAAGAAGVQTVQGTPLSAAATATGTAATARLFKDDATPDEQITGLTVGTAAAHVIIDNTSITSGQTVNLNSATVTMPATIAAP